ncbi:aminodeoxychorismate synthase component I [Desmospora profundinema]|uniref:aminodeoxychorismate synthase n=1 Tax=Desmospora profundinema TaxID=1571184 RepID=A0ABU1IMG4_9BACL|nr:aminodeoxychorismate synthase component I [Desmospora profundinema]MDR6225972.1 para-aminobenzoate synthetase component 1 [Desmospora profundinema]
MRVAVDKWKRTWETERLFREMTAGFPDRWLLDSCGKGRYTVMAWDPWERIALWDDQGADPLDALESLLVRLPHVDAPNGAPPFLAGVLGWLGYELAWRWHAIGKPKRRHHSLPDGMWMVPRKVMVMDAKLRETWVCVLDEADPEGELARLSERLNRLPVTGEEGNRPGELLAPLTPVISRDHYRKQMARIKEAIARGDIYQANFTYRVEGKVAGEPWELYRSLRRANPGVYAAYIEGDGYALLSSSPEQFVRWSGSHIETKPIKGTRPRGVTSEADAREKAALAASEKDQAELVMIVDLERNDLGQVCDIGSIRVPRLFDLEPHPTVWHQVAVVEGRLKPQTTPGAIFRAVFPGGSITGAPKLRSMQVIHQLETGRRGVYTGSIGYIDPRGFGEWNIAIRTMTWSGGEEADLSYHVGGGIVWDSDPDAEYEETLAKGRGMSEAVRQWAAKKVKA